jgi:hypothetical protein
MMRHFSSLSGEADKGKKAAQKKKGEMRAR